MDKLFGSFMRNLNPSMFARLQRLEVTGTAGSGLVKAAFRLDGTCTCISIDDSLKDNRVVEDLTRTAINDAFEKLRETAMKEMMGAMGSQAGGSDSGGAPPSPSSLPKF